MPLRIAFLPGFKGADTLLFAGDDADMLNLSAALKRLAFGLERSVELHRLPSTVASTRVVASVSTEHSGTMRRDDGFDWLHSAATWTSFAAVIQELSVSTGHHYLDGQSDEVQVLISNGEGYA